MQTLNAILIVLVFLLIGLVMSCAALYFAERVMGRRVALGSIFKEFRQKMWMTAGLGCVFFGLYLSTVALGYTITIRHPDLAFFLQPMSVRQHSYTLVDRIRCYIYKHLCRASRNQAPLQLKKQISGYCIINNNSLVSAFVLKPRFGITFNDWRKP